MPELSVPIERPLVSIVIPGYNEAGVLDRNLRVILNYLKSLEEQYEFELLIINDGSRDETGQIADLLGKEFAELNVIHHPTNFGLGQAFKTAFSAASGDYIVTMDADLSYAPETIGDLLEAISKDGTKLALASAFMTGGKLTNVPWLRKVLSQWGNKMFAVLTGNQFSTFTCMVRAYDGPFIRALEPKSEGMGIMPEVVYKTMMVGGKITEVPAHLDWTAQLADAPVRSSSMRLLAHVLDTMVSGFVFRPFLMLLVPGLLMMAFASYVNFWLVIELFQAFGRADGVLAEAAALVFAEHPATMLIGLLTLVLSIQLISLGALSLQSKKYFEETYYQMVKLRRQIRYEAAGMPVGGDRSRRRSHPDYPSLGAADADKSASTEVQGEPNRRVASAKAYQ